MHAALILLVSLLVHTVTATPLPQVPRSSRPLPNSAGQRQPDNDVLPSSSDQGGTGWDSDYLWMGLLAAGATQVPRASRFIKNRVATTMNRFPRRGRTGDSGRVSKSGPPVDPTKPATDATADKGIMWWCVQIKKAQLNPAERKAFDADPLGYSKRWTGENGDCRNVETAKAFVKAHATEVAEVQRQMDADMEAARKKIRDEKAQAELDRKNRRRNRNKKGDTSAGKTPSAIQVANPSVERPRWVAPSVDLSGVGNFVGDALVAGKLIWDGLGAGGGAGLAGGGL